MLDRSHHALRSHCGHFQYVSLYSLWLLLYKMTSVCSPSARIPDGEAGVQRACCFLSVASTVTLPSLISAELRNLCSFKGQRKRDHRWTCRSACFRLCSFWQAHGLVLGVHIWFSFVGLFVLNDAVMLVLWCVHLTRLNYMPKSSLSSVQEAGLKETLSAEGWGRRAARFL